MYRSLYIQKLEKELHEIFSVTPNDLGNKHLTMTYKFVTKPLKQMPFLYLVPISFAAAMVLYIFLGHLVIRLVSLLQYGF